MKEIIKFLTLETKNLDYIKISFSANNIEFKKENKFVQYNIKKDEAKHFGNRGLYELDFRGFKYFDSSKEVVKELKKILEG
jgi:hypothetical protein